MKNRLIFFVLFAVLLSGCSKGNNNANSSSSAGTDEYSLVEDDDIIVIDKNDKEIIESSIVSSNLQSHYFPNDNVLLDDVLLSYHDTMLRSDKGIVTFPNGEKQQKNGSFVVHEKGEYLITFEIELYAEILNANYIFNVIDFEEKYLELEPVDKNSLSLYCLKEYTPKEVEKAILFNRQVDCVYEHALSPKGEIVSTMPFVLSELGEYSLIYTYEDANHTYKCTRKLISKEKYTNKTGVFASAIGENSTISITPNTPGGIKATLYKNEYIQFNEIIDLSKARFSNYYVLMGPRFVDNTICFKKMTIKMTDLEDSENYVLIDLLNTGVIGRTFVRAYARGQDENIYGSLCICSMFGNPNECQVNIFYDNYKKSFTCGSVDNLCGDLDSSSYGDNRWNGFSNDECLVSVYADEWEPNVECAQIEFDWVDDSREYKVR